MDLITRPTERATIREDYEGVLGQIRGYVFPNFKYLWGFLCECRSLTTVQVQEQSRVSYLVRIKRVAGLRNGLPVRPQLKVEGAMKAKDFRHHLVDPFRVRDFRFSTRCGFCNEWWECRLWPRRPDGMRFSWRKLGGRGSRRVFQPLFPPQGKPDPTPELWDSQILWTLPFPVQWGLQRAMEAVGLDPHTDTWPDPRVISSYPLDLRFMGPSSDVQGQEERWCAHRPDLFDAPQHVRMQWFQACRCVVERYPMLLLGGLYARRGFDAEEVEEEDSAFPSVQDMASRCSQEQTRLLRQSQQQPGSYRIPPTKRRRTSDDDLPPMKRRQQSSVGSPCRDRRFAPHISESRRSETMSGEPQRARPTVQTAPALKRSREASSERQRPAKRPRGLSPSIDQAQGMQKKRHRSPEECVDPSLWSKRQKKTPQSSGPSKRPRGESELETNEDDLLKKRVRFGEHSVPQSSESKVYASVESPEHWSQSREQFDLSDGVESSSEDLESAHLQSIKTEDAGSTPSPEDEPGHSSLQGCDTDDEDKDSHINGWSSDSDDSEGGTKV